MRAGLCARLVFTLASAVVAGISGSCSVNPATGQRQLALMSEAQEIQLGREADGEISAQMGLYPDEELQRYVQDLGLKLARTSERPNLPWQFRVVDDPVVNAFALPGGFIYVTRGILSHLNSEAELVGVLGHEIGHVTGRHGVEQMSKAQLAQVGLIATAVAWEDFRPYAQYASAGLGLLFLKFGRDDERQADDLGLRYLARNAYEPDEMPKVFRTLDRVSNGAGGRVPNWLSTHPAPEDRVQRLTQAIATLPPESQQGAVNREPYLQRLDGLVFGDNPREGFFKDNTFYHPGMAFQLSFPAGWKTQNQKQAVVAVSPTEDAAVVLSLAGAESPEAAEQGFFQQQGIERGSLWQQGFYNFRRMPAQGTQEQELRGIVGFFEYGGSVFALRGFSLGERWQNHGRAVTDALASFQRLRDKRYLNVQPARVELVRLSSAMTLAEFQQRYPSSITLDRLAIVNGFDPQQRLEAGTSVKRVLGGQIP